MAQNISFKINLNKKVFISVLSLFSTLSFAEDAQPLLARVGGTLGASWSIGKLGNSDMGLNSRSINSFSLEVLPGYRIDNNWFVGPDFDYRWQGQITSLDSAGGTNLKGHGWLLGLGAGYRLNESFSLQAAFNFLGKYFFGNQTSTAEDNHLSAPLGLRVKGQYHLPSLPISIDLDLQYQRWATLTVTDTSYSNTSTQWLAGLGVSWYIGELCRHRGQSIDQAKASPETVTKEVVTVPKKLLSKEQIHAFQEELEQVIDVHSTEDGFVVDVQGEEGFESNRADLTNETKANLEKTIAILKKSPDLQFRIDGHADSSGLSHKNQVLSEARAESVKRLFIDSGIDESRISIQGQGDSSPRKSNQTKKGRAENRRIEIFVE